MATIIKGIITRLWVSEARWRAERVCYPIPCPWPPSIHRNKGIKKSKLTTMKEKESELSSDKFQQSFGIWKGRGTHRLVSGTEETMLRERLLEEGKEKEGGATRGGGKARILSLYVKHTAPGSTPRRSPQYGGLLSTDTNGGSGKCWCSVSPRLSPPTGAPESPANLQSHPLPISLPSPTFLYMNGQPGSPDFGGRPRASRKRPKQTD